MFGNKKQAEPAPQLANLPTGSQYALTFAFIGSTAPSIAKGINKHLGTYPAHKVVAITSVDKQGAVVVFEVR